MLEFFQQRDFPDSCGGNTFLFLFEPDFLEGDGGARGPVPRFVDNTISPFADLLDFLVLEVFCYLFFVFCFVLGGSAERRRGEGRNCE